MQQRVVAGGRRRRAARPSTRAAQRRVAAASQVSGVAWRRSNGRRREQLAAPVGAEQRSSRSRDVGRRLRARRLRASAAWCSRAVLGDLEGRRQGEDRACRAGSADDPAGGERAAVAYAVDRVDERHARVARPDEVGVQGVDVAGRPAPYGPRRPAPGPPPGRRRPAAGGPAGLRPRKMSTSICSRSSRSSSSFRASISRISLSGVSQPGRPGQRQASHPGTAPARAAPIAFELDRADARRCRPAPTRDNGARSAIACSVASVNTKYGGDLLLLGGRDPPVLQPLAAAPRRGRPGRPRSGPACARPRRSAGARRPGTAAGPARRARRRGLADPGGRRTRSAGAMPVEEPRAPAALPRRPGERASAQDSVRCSPRPGHPDVEQPALLLDLLRRLRRR